MSLLLWISISEQEMDGNVLDYHRTIDCQWKDDVFCWTPCVAMIINGYCQYRILNTLALNIWMQYLTKGELNMTFLPWFSPNTCTTEIQCTKRHFFTFPLIITGTCLLFSFPLVNAVIITMLRVLLLSADKKLERIFKPGFTLTFLLLTCQNF